MAFHFLRRTRGINFLLGGTVVALGFLVLSMFAGGLDVGVGTPDVRIDGPVSRD